MERLEFYKLHNQIKHYEWGSAQWIPQLLGIDNAANRPFAEMWMGCHPASPSQVILLEGETALSEIVSPNGLLGKAAKSSGLPFLFKLLAAENPLSIQAHPNSKQARAGFKAENREGIPLDAPNRNYKDPNHKPEIICALTPFIGMCGFRHPKEIKQLFDIFRTAPSPLREIFSAILQTLESPDTKSALQHFFYQLLYSFPPSARAALAKFVLSVHNESREWSLVQKFAQLYPSDAALLAPLYLNVFELNPGEALFLPAGTLHAYIHGFGVELMANSDNVLRGGLTPKYLDIPELLKILDFSPTTPQIIKAPENANRFAYPAPCEEFSLVQMHGKGGDAAPLTFCEKKPAIIIVVDGELGIQGTQEKIILHSGESIFIPPKSKLQFSGDYTLYAALAGK